MDDDLEEGEGGADSVSMKSERGRGCQKAVHNVVRVWRESNKEEQLWALLDGADNSLDRGI